MSKSKRIAKDSHPIRQVFSSAGWVGCVFLGAFVAAMVGCCAWGKPASQATTQDMVSDLESKTVAMVEPMFLMFQGDVVPLGVRAYCSGVWVGPSVFLTAAHCINSNGLPTFYVGPNDDENPRECQLYAVDTQHDLALFQSVDASPAHRIAAVYQGEIHKGLEVQTMGAPLGIMWSYSRGEVSNFTFQLDFETIQATAPISPGNSGGGLYSMTGELIGMADAYAPRGQLLNFFVPREFISKLLKAALQ